MQFREKLKFLVFELFIIFKCVTKRECVTSKLRKDVRGYCSDENQFERTNTQPKNNTKNFLF